MNTAQAGAYLCKSRYWMQTHWRPEGIPSYQIGGEFFFLKEDLDAYVASKRIEPRAFSRDQAGFKNTSKVSLAS
jgi:hypothetical protein